MGKRELASSWLPACEEIFLLTKHKITWPYRTGNPLEISSDVMIVLLRNDYKGAACRSLWQELPILRGVKEAGCCRSQILRFKSRAGRTRFAKLLVRFGIQGESCGQFSTWSRSRWIREINSGKSHAVSSLAGLIS
jgi:hypothetical protein